MNDRVLGVFDDEEAAHEAVDALAAAGVERKRLTVERVLGPDHRGLGDSDKVHSLLHAPRIEEDEPVADDAGTVILVVDMADRPDGMLADSPFDVYDNEAMEAHLETLGATETRTVEATPGLDL